MNDTAKSKTSRLVGLGTRLYVAAISAALAANEAIAGATVSSFGATSGAGSNRIDQSLASLGKTGQAVYDFLVIVFTVGGVLTCGVSLYQLYKANKEERESPKGAIWGLIIGGSLTVVTLIAGLMGNTVTP